MSNLIRMNISDSTNNENKYHIRENNILNENFLRKNKTLDNK